MSVLILDQFTDTNGTALASHTIGPTNTPATSWTDPKSNVHIEGNAASVISEDVNPVPVTLDAGAADVTITCNITPQTDGNGTGWDGIVFRYQDSSNFWLARWQQSASQIQIYEFVTGTANLRATASLAGSGAYTLTVTLIGNSIQAAVGSTVATYTSSDYQTATKHGLWPVVSSPNTPSTFDDFQVATSGHLLTTFGVGA